MREKIVETLEFDHIEIDIYEVYDESGLPDYWEIVDSSNGDLLATSWEKYPSKEVVENVVNLFKESLGVNNVTA